MTLDPASRARLTPRTAERFVGESLFARIARAVCAAGCLPRKELYESWEVARRVRRRFRGGRIVDVACGHGLVAHLMLILDDTSPIALAVDRRLTKSAVRLNEALVRHWPRLAGRIELREATLAETPLSSRDVVVSAHACGSLTDEILVAAAAVRARVAVLPCCQEASAGDRGGLEGWLEPSLAIDVTRAARLREAGYDVSTQHVPATITPKNRLLLGWTAEESGATAR